MARSTPLLGGVLVLASCSLVFDATELTDGTGAGGGSSPTSPTAGSSGSATSTGASGPSTGAGPTGGGGAGGAPTSTAAGGGGLGGAGGAGGLDGSGGAGACGPRFCETEGADADRCFDFDGADPFAGLERFDPDLGGNMTTVAVVDDPVVSCPRAVETRVDVVGGTRAYAQIGFDLPGEIDQFTWAFSVHRVATESDETTNTLALVDWSSVDRPCQLLVQMRDVGEEGRVSVYVQAHDGTDWVMAGAGGLSLPRPTLGAWTRVEVDLDLVASVATLRAEGLESSAPFDLVCGPATSVYNLDVGHHHTDRVQSSVFDDLTIRLPDP